MMTWLERVAHYKGYQNLLQESEEFGFPLGGRKPRESFHCKALRGLGRRLAHWGQRLQERYPASWQAHRTG
jgi:hypothetical protein